MQVVQIRHRQNGKVAYYSPNGGSYESGQTVIIETDKVRDFGHILGNEATKAESDVELPLKKVLRIANPFDLKKIAENRDREKKAFSFCRGKIDQEKLEMKLINVEYSFDRKRLKFNFTAWNKVDFRSLVKILAKEFKTNIELRQIGVRDAAQLLGGIGICGRSVCCSTHLVKFETITQKMARVQERSTNPEKNSGICGRLRCCLRYEYEEYLENKKELEKSSNSKSDKNSEKKLKTEKPNKSNTKDQSSKESSSSKNNNNEKSRE